MVDLSHWVFADDFTPHEAAHLIVGADPSIESAGRNVEHIKNRMLEAYTAAIQNLEFRFIIQPCLADDWNNDGTDTVDEKHTLNSIDIDALYEGYFHGDEVSISLWLEDQKRTDFLRQRFSRDKLAKWLNENMLVSAYQFAPVSHLKPNELGGKNTLEKPLNKRERETLLTIIAALCKECRVDINSPSKAGDLIQSMTDLLGAPVAKRTIEEHLKKIPKALETRMK
jgi:hypothetical protein